PEVFNMLLQILDDGRLTDSHGRVVNFKNTIMIMTSNIGSHLIKPVSMDASDEERKKEYAEMKGEVTNELRNHFRPEFLNRIDEIIVFHALDRSHMDQIARLLVKRVANRLEQKDIHLDISHDAVLYLAKIGYDPTYGARPLRRAIQAYLENPLSRKIISGEFSEGDTVRVSAGEEGLKFTHAADSAVHAG
ncbi:MAG TPA: AAA family ATPase, partial [bacterium]